MKEPMSSCLGCTMRHVGCHDECKSYQEYKELHALWVKLIRDKKYAMYEADEVVKKRFEKYNKQKEKHQKEGACN